MENILCWND